MGNPPTRRGRLKIFLGYAAGVGKTFRMLEEGHELVRQGADVVIGYFEPHGRQDTIDKAGGLETVPRRRIAYRGHSFEEMDTAAILARHPEICLVDELAHTNVPGSERQKRWEDVMGLLEAGIDVLTTLNIQHLESLNDHVFQVTGIRVRETLPDWIVTQADEVVMVDVTVEALLNRLRRGAVYDQEKAQKALKNFFKESTLAGLRELALRQTAYQVELHHEVGEAGSAPDWQVTGDGTVPQSELAGSREKILIHVTPDPASAMLIRRGRRLADYLRTECFAVYVCPYGDLSSLPLSEREAVERHLNFARNLHIEAVVVHGNKPAEALVEFSRQRGITRLLLTRDHDGRWQKLFRGSLVFKVVKLASHLRITVVSGTGKLPSKPR
ncbi:MAG: histidine kinase [Acidobacteria bacterium]|nr:histidine kinase [Acidobacteriota bacterium]